GIEFNAIKTFSTPRRLTILGQDLAEKQADLDEVKKGPAKKIALHSEGNFTKAAQGFVRGPGRTTDDIYFADLKATAYAY
ncbi:glycine--tRNA ligase subunit beta, partial [Lactobacillus jensenii]|uniref:glycine--tRNA ligase subunit beta n=1 Tax=Lactobacillus jensenii TaxID=109790 RepID=UPI0028700D54